MRRFFTVLLIAGASSCKSLPESAIKADSDPRPGEESAASDEKLKEQMIREFAADNLFEKKPAAEGGTWAAPIHLPGMQATQAVLMPDRSVLIANGSSNRTGADALSAEVEGKRAVYHLDNFLLFDPLTNAPRRIFQFAPASPLPVLHADDSIKGLDLDLYASGAMHLFDGSILFAGGTAHYDPTHGSKSAWLFDAKSKAFAPQPMLMRSGHWHPTVQALGDGRIAVLSGFGEANEGDEGSSSTTVEVYDPFTKKWDGQDIKNLFVAGTKKTFLTYIGTRWDNAPRAALMPDGRLLLTGDGIGPGGRDGFNQNLVFLEFSPRGQPFEVKVSGQTSARRIDGKGTKFVHVAESSDDSPISPGTLLPTANNPAVVYDPRSGSGDLLAFGGHYGSNQPFMAEDTDTATERTHADMLLFRVPRLPGGKVGLELYENFMGARFMDNKFCDEKPPGKFPQLCRSGPNAFRNLDARVMHIALALPTQEILILGGGNYSYRGPAMHPLLLTPEREAAGGFRTSLMNAHALPHQADSSALLLPDGRVMLAGGNTGRARINTSPEALASLITKVQDRKDGFIPVDQLVGKASENETEAGLTDAVARGLPKEIQYLEIFSPPYLHKREGRPEIAGWQTESIVPYGGNLRFTVIDPATTPALANVTLIKLGSVTAASDTGQRLIRPRFVQNGNQVSVTMPERGNLAPPGYYMLFYVNDGVPSPAKMVRLLCALRDAKTGECSAKGTVKGQI